MYLSNFISWCCYINWYELKTNLNVLSCVYIYLYIYIYMYMYLLVKKCVSCATWIYWFPQVHPTEPTLRCCFKLVWLIIVRSLHPIPWLRISWLPYTLQFLGKHSFKFMSLVSMLICTQSARASLIRGVTFVFPTWWFASYGCICLRLCNELSHLKPQPSRVPASHPLFSNMSGRVQAHFGMPKN